MKVGADDPDHPRINPELLALMRAQADRAQRLAAAMAPGVRAAQAQRRLAAAFVLPPGLIETLARVRESRPPNWPESMDFDRLQEVIQDDGLPLVWVPRPSIVNQVLGAPDRASGVKVLLAHRTEVIEDCREVLSTITTPTYGGKVALTVQAADAFADGHAEAAQALAVVVVESATRRAINESSTRVKHWVRLDLDAIPYVELRLRAALPPW